MPSPLFQAALRPVISAAPRCAAAATRSFSHLPTLRPTTLRSTTASVFRLPSQTLLSTPAPGAVAQAEVSQTLDLVAKTSISANPALLGTQIRCGPRPTMSGHSRLIQKRRHGFLSRIRTRNGRKTLTRRKERGRKRLSA
ncbi:hypothetical protein QBC35DRAFT_470709 [Podospora australis]|uniref:Mitochondrial LSU ribosomal protein L34 n=1 Tax=Podospora australis TaxID=1536484 RepID=A0AAN6X403_9PEZI|nr:hypothetical protein QBC35DRAFT_470709 [Podospora australis]